MFALKLTTVGASTGLILPKDALAYLRVGKGDTLFLTEVEDGGFRLTPYDPDFETQMKVAEKVMHDDRQVLRALSQR